MLLSPLPGIPKHLGGKDYVLSQGFGGNAEDYEDFGMVGHNGYDLAPFIKGQTGRKLHAPMDGFVRVKNTGKIGYGLHVILTGLPHPETGKKIELTLAHLADVQMGIDGKFIRTLDPFGIMGSTGYSSGVHCHITPRYILPNGTIQDYQNGFHGAQPIGQFFRIWQEKSPLITSPQ